MHEPTRRGVAILWGEGESIPGRGRSPLVAARGAAGLILWALLAFLIARPELTAVRQKLAPTSPAPFASLIRSFRSFDIEKDARPGPLPHVFRLAYPQDWFTRDRESVPPMAVFVDGRKATWLIEEPFFETLAPQNVYAYLREPVSQSLFVVCLKETKCARVEMVRDDLRAFWALAWTQPALTASALTRVSLVLTGLVFLVWFVTKRLSGPLLACLLAAHLWIVVAGGMGRGSGAALAALALTGTTLLLTPLSRHTRRGFDQTRRLLTQPASHVSVPQLSLFLLVALASAWLGIRTVPGWYPSDTDDTHHYVSAASRFLRTDDLIGSALQPENWRYSAYPLVLASFSRLLGLHPMDAYAWVSGLGALALVSASGALAWMATGRFTTGLLATWISGTWGGLGVWAWILERGLHWVRSGMLRLLDTDYYDARFLGEFTGPYSELTSYISSAPFYPREAGLVPFWLGLGLLYRRLRPEVPPPSLVAVCALFLTSAALYPYYGLAAPLALGIAAVAEGCGDDAMRRRRRQTIGAGVLVFVGAVFVGDFASRAYRGLSAWDWVARFLVAAPSAIEADKPMPSMDFLVARIVSGQFFFAIAFVGALVLGFRPRGSVSDPQRRAAWVTLVVCVGHGLLNQSSNYLHMLLLNFRWFVSWRALLAPVAALIAALFIEEVANRSRSRTFPWLVTLALTPALSSVLWSYSVTHYLSDAKAWGGGRGLMAPLWSEYGAHGRSLLGRVVIPEPLGIEGASLGERVSASAAFGIFVQGVDHLLHNDAALLPERLGVPPEVRAVALRKDSRASARLEATDCCAWLASYGAYDIYVRREAGSAPPPPRPPR